MKKIFFYVLISLEVSFVLMGESSALLLRCADIEDKCKKFFEQGYHVNLADVEQRIKTYDSTMNYLCINSHYFGDGTTEPSANVIKICQTLWRDTNVSYQSLCKQSADEMKRQNEWIILYNSGIAQKINEGEQPIPGLKPEQEKPIPVLCLEK